MTLLFLRSPVPLFFSVSVFFRVLFFLWSSQHNSVHVFRSLRSWPQAFQESWSSGHWQKMESIERLFATQLPPKGQWPTWQPGQPSAEKACLSVLLAQFSAIAQPSQILKTPSQVAMQKKCTGGVSFQNVKKWHFSLTSKFHWATWWFRYPASSWSRDLVIDIDI